MVTLIRLDHLVIAVRNLENAIGDYVRLGFNVSTGGRHTHAPTHNALIFLDDGAYIELIEWLAPADGERWYDRLNVAGEGIIDFALCPASIAEAIERTGGAGAAYQAPMSGSRVQPDGQEIRWLLGWPVNEALPFLCSDVTDRSLRVPTGRCRAHSNGITGIREVVLAVTDFDAAVAAYERLLQSKASHTLDAAFLGHRVAWFPVGEAALLLVSTFRRDAGKRQDGNGQIRPHEGGVIAVRFRTADASKSVRLDSSLTHGAALST